MMADFFSVQFISLWEAILRMALALFAGLLVGLERSYKRKPADFRVFMIVAITCCLIAMLGQELYSEYSMSENVVVIDLGKIIAGTMTGIGFLGAGAIIKQRGGEVIGTATGASIWASGGIGLSLGFGVYSLALIALLAVMAILVVGGLCKLGDD